MTPPETCIREADDRAAPFVSAYIFVAVAAIAAMLAWVFWFRGYA